MSRTLLLADDSVTIQRVIELTFADEDIKVIAVGDGQQAISRINADRPDVVLADVGMPERDGYEVAAHVKGTPELAHIPVLLLTGAFEPIDEPRARASGCDGVLVKPFEPQMVINRVKDLLAGRRPPARWSGAPVQVSSAPADAAGSAGADPGSHRESATPADQSQRGTSPEALDEYFDRLDAAFSAETSAPVPAAAEQQPAAPPAQAVAASVHDFGTWDIPLTPAPVGAERGPAPEPSAWPEQNAAAPDSLADAFSALLTAEQRIAAMAGQPAGELPDALVNEIVRRIVARMSDDVVRATVLEVAERLVREEIQKLKDA